MPTSEFEAALKESRLRLSACMLDLVILMETVRQTLDHVTKSIECVRDRIGEMEEEDNANKRS